MLYGRSLSLPGLELLQRLEERIRHALQVVADREANPGSAKASARATTIRELPKIGDPLGDPNISHPK